MEILNESQGRENSLRQPVNKKEIWRTVGLVLSFYIAAIIISIAIPETNYTARFVLMILPAIATFAYGYWAAMKENYVVLKVVFIMLLVSVALEWAFRILSRI